MKSFFQKMLLSVVFCFSLFLPGRVLAWGNGHDDVNRLALQLLPAEIIGDLSAEMREKVVKLSHTPDDFTPWEKWNKQGLKVAAEDMEVLQAYKLKHPYSLHSANGQAVSLILLANAFRAKSQERRVLWMACILHTFADEAAANHDPLIGCMTYSFGSEYKMKIGKGVGLDYANIARTDAGRKIIQNLVKDVTLAPFSSQVEEALLQAMMSGLESNAYLTQRGCAIGASYAPEASEETMEKARVALAELGTYGTIKGCNAIVTAWELAKAEGELALTDAIKKKYTQCKVDYGKERPLAKDSLFADLLGKQTTDAMAVGFLVEPSVSMNHGKLAFSAKLLSSSAMRTLQTLNIPFRLIDVRTLESEGLPTPEDLPVLVVCAGGFYVSKPGQEFLKKYVAAGGRLLWIGGEHRNLLGKLSACLVKTENDKLPVSQKYGKKALIGEKVRFLFREEFSKGLAGKEYRFVHCPNTRAGWQVPRCPYLLSGAMDKDIMVLAEMKVDGETTPIAGALVDSEGRGKHVFLPEYLVAPYLLSDEETVMNPGAMQLDKVARTVFLSALKLLDEDFFRLVVSHPGGSKQHRLKVGAVSASSADKDFVAENAVDGIPGTRWSTGEKGAELTLDLSREAVISACRIRWVGKKGRIYRFRFATSLDGTNWSDLGGERKSLGKKGGYAYVNYKLEPTRARWLRLVCLGNSENSWTHIDDLYVIGSGGIPAGQLFAKEIPESALHRVGDQESFSGFGYYGMCPESPDASRICYTRFVNPPTSQKAHFPAELWVCNRNLSGQRKIAEIAKAGAHNAAMALWVDNQTLVYQSGYHETCVVNADTGKALYEPLAGQLQHNAHAGQFLICRNKAEPEVAKRGIYAVTAATGEERLILPTSALNPFADRIGVLECDRWVIQHVQWSAEGSFVAFKLWAKNGLPCLLFTCRADGSELVCFGYKPMHFQWFDDETLFGHDDKVQDDLEDNKYLRRWRRDGSVVETLSGPGCHPAMSSDRRWIATETWYGSDPVCFLLYSRGKMQPAYLLADMPFLSIWSLHAHVNPSFSRDGKRVYFNRAVADGLSQAYYVDLP